MTRTTTDYFQRGITMIDIARGFKPKIQNDYQNGWDGGHWPLLRKFYGRNHNLVDSYGISVSQMTTDKFHLSQALLGPFLVHHLSNNTN
jgi:hypothetical protein